MFTSPPPPVPPKPPCAPFTAPPVPPAPSTPVDVSAGDKIPRKGGPGITRSDLLVINKIDLAPLVGASLEVMDRDAKTMRKERPFVFSNLKNADGLQDIIDFIVTEGMLPPRRADALASSA